MAQSSGAEERHDAKPSLRVPGVDPPAAVDIARCAMCLCPIAFSWSRVLSCFGVSLLSAATLILSRGLTYLLRGSFRW